MGKLFIMPLNRSRRRLGAPLAKDITSLMSSRLILLPVSRHVAPPDPRWPAHVQPTGYWFARPLSDWSPPPDLLDFLAAGERPLAISLGVMSLAGRQAHQSAEIVLQALRDLGARAIIQGWDSALQQRDGSRNIYFAGSLPHGWLFDQVSAVVLHGGFGTTAAALRAGVPAVVIPHIIDQFYWGQRVQQLGVGPKPISRGQLTAKGLSEALAQALNDEAMRRKASELGAAMRAESDGVTTAVHLIEQLLR
jgi:UDP:flavonoid glycosyltransferase YjiC (YdhE family)